MNRMRILSLVLLTLLPLAPAAARAQEAPPVESPVERIVESSAAPGEYASALPAATAPPRTLRAYWYLFVAYAVVWLLLFGYVISLGRRFARVERDLAKLTTAPTL